MMSNMTRLNGVSTDLHVEIPDLDEKVKVLTIMHGEESLRGLDGKMVTFLGESKETKD